MFHMKQETKLQDVRIRNVPEPMVRRLKSILMAQNLTLAEWFLIVAAKYGEKAS